MNIRFSEEDLERCTLTNPHEIAFQIKSMIKRCDRASVTFQEGHQSFLTILLDVSSKDGLFYFDISGSQEINQAFVKADSCTFSAVADGIRIQFTTRNCRETRHDGAPAFAAPLPQSLLRLQRRDTFRLQLPSTNPYTCRIRRGTPAEELLAVYDISVGGIGIMANKEIKLERLDLLPNSWLDLHETGMIRCTLEVRYVAPIDGLTGKPLWHMGTRFVDLPQSDETLIQRFMARIEAERRLLGGD